MPQEEPKKVITYIETDKFDNGNGNLNVTKFSDEGNTYVTKQYNDLSDEQKAIYNSFYEMMEQLN